MFLSANVVKGFENAVQGIEVCRKELHMPV